MAIKLDLHGIHTHAMPLDTTIYGWDVPACCGAWCIFFGPNCSKHKFDKVCRQLRKTQYMCFVFSPHRPAKCKFISKDVSVIGGEPRELSFNEMLDLTGIMYGQGCGYASTEEPQTCQTPYFWRISSSVCFLSNLNVVTKAHIDAVKATLKKGDKLLAITSSEQPQAEKRLIKSGLKVMMVTKNPNSPNMLNLHRYIKR